MNRLIIPRDGHRFCTVQVLACIIALSVLMLSRAVTTTAAATAYYSFTGWFADGTETQSFLFSLNSALRSPGPFALRTWQYEGGTNAAGEVIAAGGFDPVLLLYNDTPALIAENDDYPPGRDSLINWSTSGMPFQLPIDNYQLNLTAYNDTLGGRDGHWAVDLQADAAKFTLTGVDDVDATGETSIGSLSLGSDDHRLPAKLQLGPMEQLSVVNRLDVGKSGSAEIVVSTGSLFALATQIGVGVGSFGSVTAKLGGSIVGTIIDVGVSGEGELRVESGGYALFGLVELGSNFDSLGTGTLTVTGYNSVATVNGDLLVGHVGTGFLYVQNQGWLNSSGTGQYGETVGFSIASPGTAEVDGLNSLWQTDKLMVGYYGQGTVRVTNGGKIDTSGNAYIGATSYGYDSSVSLIGAAADSTPATWQVSGNLFVAGNEVVASTAANSKLAINSGGRVDVAGTATVWNDGGNLELIGGEMETGSLIVKPGATFTQTDGMLTINGGTFDPGTGTADYVITGTDSADRPKVVLTNGADSVPLGMLWVGQDSYGEVVIEHGATLTAAIVYTSFAPNAPASSKITVQGSNSRLFVTAPSSVSSLSIGNSGPGDLWISAGGQVHVQQGGVMLACCDVWGRTGSGQIIVEGEDSLLEAKFIDFRSAGADSRVTIRDHGVVHATDVAAVSAVGPTSFHGPTDIVVEVTDPGSRLQVDSELLIITGFHVAGPLGAGSTARLKIRDGGTVQVAGDVWLNGNPETAYVDVEGGASSSAAFDINGAFYVGGSQYEAYDGIAQLTVAGGGQVTARSVKVWQSGTVELNGGIISTSNLELAGGMLQGNGAVVVSGELWNAGVVAPGLSAGIITVAGGNYVQDSTGTLEIEIGGTNPFQYDQLNITGGSAALNGTFTVSLIDPTGGTNPYIPNAGDLFHVLTAARNVAFSPNWTSLPTLRGGLHWWLGTPTPQSLDVGIGGVLGDYNRNGVVDAADFVFWRHLLGQPSSPWYYWADGDGSGYLDIGDLAVWRAHFGQTAPPIGSAMDSPAKAIPEPAAVFVIGLGIVAILLTRTRFVEVEFPSGRRSTRCLKTERLRIATISLGILLPISATAGIAAPLADVANDFSPTNNPNGAWAYGWSTSLASELNVYPNDVHGSNGIDAWQDNGHVAWGAPNVAHNSTSGVVNTDPAVVTWQPYQFSLHPGAGGEFSHAVWTSNVAGYLNLTGAFTGIDHTGTTSDVHVLVNATSTFDGFVNGYGNTSLFSATVAVAIGDRIDFAVGNGSNQTFWDDSTALTATIVFRVPGDYNGNGVVDAADYTVWRDTLGSTVDLRANGDDTGASAGVIDEADYLAWRSHFGQTAGSGTDSNTNAAVPEPSGTISTLIVTLLALPLMARWLKKRSGALAELQELGRPESVGGEE